MLLACWSGYNNIINEIWTWNHGIVRIQFICFYRIIWWINYEARRSLYKWIVTNSKFQMISLLLFYFAYFHAKLTFFSKIKSTINFHLSKNTYNGFQYFSVLYDYFNYLWLFSIYRFIRFLIIHKKWLLRLLIKLCKQRFLVYRSSNYTFFLWIS